MTKKSPVWEKQPQVQLVVDVEATRAAIRHSLTFEFKPLEGKGQPIWVGFLEWSDATFRPIVEEILVAYWEVSAQLDRGTVIGDIYRLGNFFHFLEDCESTHSARHSPTTLKEVTFHTQRDFEHWLWDRPTKKFPRLVEERKQALLAFIATQALPRSKRTVKPTVSVSAVCAAAGAPGSYFSRYPLLRKILAEAAQHQGLRMPKLRARHAASSEDASHLAATNAGQHLTAKTVEEIYYTLSKTLRHIERRRPQLLADDFVLASLDQSDYPRSRGVKSVALLPNDFQTIEAACLAAIRRTKARILIEGPARATQGRADPLPGETDREWSRDLDNLVSYLAKYAPCQVVGRGVKRQEHPRFVNALVYRKSETGHEIAQWLSPDLFSLLPFLVRMACSEYGPLNLAGLLSLHVDLDNPRQHCIRPSPTPGNKRIFYGKPRAGIDQGYVDVPARSVLDPPGLIETVIELTAGLRVHVDPTLRHALWLYLSDKRGIRVLTGAAVTQNLGRFVLSENVRGDNGEILKGFHFRRLRPTVIASVALDNGLEVAQQRADHADPRQTLAYVNNPGNPKRVRIAVEAAQSKAIASVRSGFSERPPRDDVERVSQALNIPLGAAAEIVAGKRDKLFNSCIDDKNGHGPEVAGRVCGKFEACLICVNSVILERHLPRLIAYYHHWLSMADKMDDAAWQDAHALNCEIVERHLTKFDPDVVARITAEVMAGPLLICYRRFKQS